MADWRNGSRNSGVTEELLARENQSGTEKLSNKVGMLKSLAFDIESDTKDHNRYLNGMSGDFASSQGLLSGSMNRITHMVNSGKGNRKLMCYIILGLVGLFVISYYIISRFTA